MEKFSVDDWLPGDIPVICTVCVDGGVPPEAVTFYAAEREKHEWDAHTTYILVSKTEVGPDGEPLVAFRGRLPQVKQYLREHQIGEEP